MPDPLTAGRCSWTSGTGSRMPEPAETHARGLLSRFHQVIDRYASRVESGNSPLFSAIGTDTGDADVGSFVGSTLDLVDGQVAASRIVLSQGDQMTRLAAGVTLRAAFLNCAKVLVVADGFSRNDNSYLTALLASEAKRVRAMGGWYSALLEAEGDSRGGRPLGVHPDANWEAVGHLLPPSFKHDYDLRMERLSRVRSVSDTETVARAINIAVPLRSRAGAERRYAAHAVWKVLNALAHNELDPVRSIAMPCSHLGDASHDREQGVLRRVNESVDWVSMMADSALDAIERTVASAPPDPEWIVGWGRR